MVVIFSLFLATLITYFPPTQKLLGVVPLNFFQWCLLIGKGFILVVIIEIAKAVAMLKSPKITKAA
jgi:magnesium-transporting ATPase (P-type)